MRPAPTRIVLDNRPYLVTRHEDGSLDRAFGPFTPGAEPNLESCTPKNEVHDSDTRASLEALLGISPSLPASDDSLAGRT
jgi:hypothetical protein